MESTSFSIWCNSVDYLVLSHGREYGWEKEDEEVSQTAKEAESVQDGGVCVKWTRVAKLCCGNREDKLEDSCVCSG